MDELAAGRIVDVFNCTRSASISGAARVFDFCGKQAADAALLEYCNRNMNRSELVLSDSEYALQKKQWIICTNTRLNKEGE